MKDSSRIRSTTILCVRRGGRLAMGGDGQVTMGENVVKQKARKIRRLYNEKVVAGFAGSTADALSLFSRFEQKLEEYPKTDFIHFAGVSPRRYRDLFERGKRKDKKGKFREWVRVPPRPIFDLKLPLWCTLEDFIAHKMSSQLKAAIRKLKTMPFGSEQPEEEAEEVDGELS